MANKDFASRLGFSLYLSNGLENNLSLIEKYRQAGFSFAFTSLNINEEGQDIKLIDTLVQACCQAGIILFVDINETSFAQFGLDGLKAIGIKAVRVDDGISVEDMANLSKVFRLVLNASILNDEMINSLQEAGLNLGEIIACHNYYPKPYTGLSREKVGSINKRLHQLGVSVISFIVGEGKRFPLFEGLPTIETQRQMRPLEAALESLIKVESDYVCVGDTSLSSKSLEEMTYLSKGVIPLKGDIPSNLDSLVFENRIDASEYVIRAAYSRSQLKGMTFQGLTKERSRGDIVIANEKFLRYESELEICLTELPQDERQLVVGQVRESDLSLLDYVQDPFKFQLLPNRKD